MCKVKGCRRPQFVGGLCGFHALQGYYRAPASRRPRAERRAAAPSPLARWPDRTPA
ncbi:MAG TPA: hypothetical protein VH880_13655 [Anaeromyxobacteraceae bacterium]|jgi:hypothetical protein